MIAEKGKKGKVKTKKDSISNSFWAQNVFCNQKLVEINQIEWWQGLRNNLGGMRKG